MTRLFFGATAGDPVSAFEASANRAPALTATKAQVSGGFEA
ncbi:hypothetical protein [Lentzea sp. CC55]|nr:hypothetical protein [Lentzea sp. CC55]